jgi:cell division protein FtsQ
MPDVVIRPGEPTPARGEDVPDVVLDELRMAFTGTPPTGPVRPDDPLVDPTVDPTFDGTLDLTFDDLPLADLDDLDGFDDVDGLDGLGGSGGPAGLHELPPADLDDDSLFGTRITGPRTSTPTGPTGPTGPTDATAAWVLDTPEVRIVPRGATGGAATTGPSTSGRGADQPVGGLPDDLPAAPGDDMGIGDAGLGSTGGPAGVRAPARPGRPTIVIGGDDSLPDAIYLDEGDTSSSRNPTDRSTRVPDVAPDGSDARGTIVIGDELEASGAFDAVEVPSRSMDPRVRARRIAVKRAQGRKRLLWVGAVAAVVVVIVAVLAVFSSSLFAVERVDVQGAPYTEARYGDRMQAVIDRMMGEPVLLVDTRAAEEELESLPWVERAFVTTDFPNRVLIDVRERQPLATFVGSDTRYRVIDRDGFVLDVLDGRPSNYMLIDGVGPDLEAGSSAGAQYSAAAQLVGALPAEIRSITVAATLDPTTGDLGLIVQNIAPVDPETPVDPEATPSEPPLVEVRIGSFNGLDGKLARLLQLVRDGLDDTAKIDVSTDDVIG